MVFDVLTEQSGSLPVKFSTFRIFMNSNTEVLMS